MRKIILALSIAILASCAKEKPKVIEGEILEVLTQINRVPKVSSGSAPGVVTYQASIDANEDGERSSTINDIQITGKVASDFTKAMCAGYQPYFVRLTLNTDGKYEVKELALMNYDVMGSQPWYQFQSDKKLIGN